MAHVIEPAASGRSKCRGCRRSIAKGELRLGERLANPFADGEMTLWFHVACASYKRPEALLQALATAAPPIDDRATLEIAARRGLEHPRLPRIDGAQRSPTGRARCRSCRELIARDSWRIGLVFFEEGQFNAAGYVHAACCHAYFGTTDVIDRIARFAPGLDAAELVELRNALEATT